MRVPAEDLTRQCRTIRSTILSMAHRARRGHIGSALSIVEVCATCLNEVRGLGSELENRDRFVLSKGHAASALYAVLAAQGLLTQDDLDTYCRDASFLATHPNTDIVGIDFATGSLGQGITFAVGAALAAKLRRDGSRVYCLLSDSELNEGSVWESCLIAAQHALDNLVVVVDFNRQQALGPTKDVLSLEGVPEAWASLGWSVIRIDGHDVTAIYSALDLAYANTQPTLLVAETIAGRGVSFMEGRIEWHYLPMTEAQYLGALDQVSGDES